MDMYYMKTFYSDYNMKNKKDKNHIQSKYCKLSEKQLILHDNNKFEIIIYLF